MLQVIGPLPSLTLAACTSRDRRGILFLVTQEASEWGTGNQVLVLTCSAVQGKIDENKEGGIMLMSGKDFFKVVY